MAILIFYLFISIINPTNTFSSEIAKIISSKTECLENFKIGVNLSDILKKYQGTLWKANEKRGEYIYVFNIADQQFSFPLIAHFYNRQLMDYWIRWPVYFLHDAIHKQLIDVFGKQQKYFHQKDHSVYLWETKDFSIRYEASCTITCFPIYLSMTTTKVMEKKYKPLTKQLQLD